jgi:dethiobiotin synthetase
MKGMFITGTDTGVGKTTVACGLVSSLVKRGHKVGVMKPCETGDGDDHRRLMAATGRALDPALVCPYRFPLAASPETAARAAGSPIDLDKIAADYHRLASDADLMLVEGAGGLLAPVGRGKTVADVAATLDLPLLIVARSALGTINHTLLTVEAARHRRLPVLGVIFSRSERLVDVSEATNPESIVRYGEVRVFGTLPWLSQRARSSADELERMTDKAIRIDNLVKLL